MNHSSFVAHENWWGSFYELSMEYYPAGNDARLLAAMRALWSTPLLHGPLAGPSGEPDQAQQPVPAPVSIGAELGDLNRLYGVLALPGQRPLGCLSLTVREEQGSDWLDFCLPMGMLELAFPVVYPLLAPTNPWLAEIDRVFLTLAEAVHAAQPFDLALVGEEVSGDAYASQITAADVAKGGYLIPAGLMQRLQPDVPSVMLPSGLHWFPYAN